MDHQIFAALFVLLAVIGQFVTMTTAAPLSTSDNHQHQRKQPEVLLPLEPERHHHQHQNHHHTSSGGHHGGHHRTPSVHQLEDLLSDLDRDTSVIIADDDKVTEVYPEHRELSLDSNGQIPTVIPSSPSTSGSRRHPPRRSERRRQRRSAALLLHATLRFCDNRPLHCASIMLQRDNIKVNIRLVDQ